MLHAVAEGAAHPPTRPPARPRAHPPTCPPLCRGQGIVPCKAGVMAGRLTDIVEGKLLSVPEVFGRLQPDKVAELMAPGVNQIAEQVSAGDYFCATPPYDRAHQYAPIHHVPMHLPIRPRPALPPQFIQQPRATPALPAASCHKLRYEVAWHVPFCGRL